MKTFNNKPNSISNGARIMVVDDEPEIGRIVTNFLCKHNHNHGVIFFTSGKGALAYLKNDMACPDERRIKLLLTDMQMPKMSGIELARQVKTLYPALPIIVMSGSANGQDRDEIFSLGADFIPKPFDLVDLLIRINSLITKYSMTFAPKGVPTNGRRAFTPEP